ncbi:hypothetical protein OG735_39955 [Streptomyces sp. NBC_01210]|uniref:hypothetical protein n=1 Tax=Streptomyces sp. NBC_01210 TaxID=2903774 RepID=UPI002E156E56|nr:hypothetical protein OG735_39955 [Streptomyces sp. NBC_01210]
MPTQENTTLKTEYADKVRADLERNRSEQERIRAEIETLQGQLATLESDHALLESMSAALGDETAAAVPAPRRGRKTAGTTPAKKTTVTKTAAAATKSAAKKSAAKTAVQKPADTVPPLTDLIHQHLSGQSEPRTAREIATALAETHPTRNISDNLVRTTTERLVARSRVDRAKQGSTVYYTAIKTETAPGPAEETTAAAS